MKNMNQDRTNRTIFVTWLMSLLCLLLTIVVIGVLVLVVGLAREPTESLHGMISSALWTTIGPHLVLISMLGIAISLLSRKYINQFIFRLSIISSSLALLGSVYVTASIIQSIKHAGGDVSLIKSLWLKPMIGNGPDLQLSFKTADGTELPVAVYKPRQLQAPVLMYIHGGGFMTGNITESDEEMRWFAEKGWLVISVGYRLWTKNQPTWNLAPADIECAALWVENNAGKYGGDINRLAVLGDSAGGNLAINYAYSMAKQERAYACGGEVTLPKAVVVQYPAVDPLAIYDDGYPIKGFEPEMLVEGYLGGSPYQHPLKVEAVSSYSYITENAPLTLIIEPDKDGLVPSSSVYQFVDEAKLKGVNIQLVKIPFANHVYNQVAFNSIGSQGRLTITTEFLKKLGLDPKAQN